MRHSLYSRCLSFCFNTRYTVAVHDARGRTSSVLVGRWHTTRIPRHTKTGGYHRTLTGRETIDRLWEVKHQLFVSQEAAVDTNLEWKTSNLFRSLLQRLWRPPHSGFMYMAPPMTARYFDVH